MHPYKTIAGPVEGYFEDRGSQFYAFMTRVKTEQEAIEFRHGIMERIPKASHYVSAYIIHDECITRCSDAQEPQGTAGPPVLSVLQGRNLSDVVCVVARIFGGTLLGKGGLMRAYTTAASRAADQAQVMLYAPCRKISTTLPYALYDVITAKLAQAGIAIADASFTDVVTITIYAQTEHINELCANLVDLTDGAAIIDVGPEEYQLVDA